MPESYLEQEYEPEFLSWKQNPSPQTTASLLGKVQPVLETALRMYAGGGNPLLASRAKLLAMEALARYDPSRAKLRTHLLSHLRGLQRWAARQQQTIRLPERVALELGRMRNARGELADRLGREPSTLELSEHMGISPTRVGQLSKVRPGLTEGQVAPISGEDEDVMAPAVVHSQARDAWHQFVYHDLEDVDRVIMEHTLGMYGKPLLSKTDIARKLNLSPGAVSQRASRIQGKLDMQENTGGLF